VGESRSAPAWAGPNPMVAQKQNEDLTILVFALGLAYRYDTRRPAVGAGARRSDVEVAHVEGVLLDELTAWFDLVAHQDAEQLVGAHGIFDANT
jgi:hypothetical protein